MFYIDTDRKAGSGRSGYDNGAWCLAYKKGYEGIHILPLGFAGRREKSTAGFSTYK